MVLSYHTTCCQDHRRGYCHIADRLVPWAMLVEMSTCQIFSITYLNIVPIVHAHTYNMSHVMTRVIDDDDGSQCSPDEFEVFADLLFGTFSTSFDFLMRYRAFGIHVAYNFGLLLLLLLSFVLKILEGVGQLTSLWNAARKHQLGRSEEVSMCTST